MDKKKIVTKSRSKGMTTQAADHAAKAAAEEDVQAVALPEETPEYLNKLLTRFTQMKEAARNRLDRVADLMGRKKAQRKWTYDKTQKMQRRLKAAAHDMEQMSYMCVEVMNRLEKH